MSDDRTKNSSYLPRSWGAIKAARHSEPTGKSNPEKAGASSESFKQKDAAIPDQKPEMPPPPKEGITSACEPEIDDQKAGDSIAQSTSEDLPSPNKTLFRLVGIRFGYACKIYNFDAGDMDLTADDWVVVKTEKGMGLGQVALPPFHKELDPCQIEGLRKVLRKSTKADFDQNDRCKQKEVESRLYCLECIAVLDLPMKLIAVECFFDGSKYVFYFTAEGRVDFRELVKRLVARFPVRIEMRQIGVRHESKMTGGLACCGQELCCSRFLTDFRPVSVKMAKNQNLSLNPTKISGVCGRLMCCLGYEHDTYEAFKKGLPRIGKAITTTKGDGVVVKHNPLAETVSIRLDEETIVEWTKENLIRDLEIVGKTSGKKMDLDQDEDEPTDYDEQLERLS